MISFPAPQVSRLTSFRRRYYAAALTSLMVTLAVLALLQPIIALAQPLVAVGADNRFDLAPLLLVGVQGLAVIVIVVGAWFIYGHVKDQSARDALVGILQKGVAFGINTVEGAAKDKTLSVNVGSQVVATALRYAMAQGPAALEHFGFDAKTAARALWARLPAVDGQVTDATFDQIVAAATGKGPTLTLGDTTASIPGLVDALLAEIARRKAGTSSPAAVDAHPSPAAPPAPAKPI